MPHRDPTPPKASTPRLTSKQVVAATLNPKTTDKQFEALVARMMAKGWKDSTIGVVRDFRRAVLEQAAAKEEKATA